MKFFSEDFVKYQVYIDPQVLKNKSIEILHSEYSNFCNSLIPSKYIWQHDPFQLTIRRDKNCLEGKTRFGENIEDEWFIVSLLMRLTKQFPETIVKVWDNDGQFLLIEAAMELPKWVKPEIMDNRVFIRGGKIHIIPLKIEKGLIKDINIALDIIRSQKENTEADEKIQAAIQRRIKDYPENAPSFTLRLCLPVEIAHLLKKDKQLVSSAVRAFYERDPIALRHGAEMKKFNPKLENMVMTMVTFSRCLYAQLSQQPFQPPKVFPKLPPRTSPDYRALSEGARLAIGFEMLYQQSKKCSKKTVHEYNFDADPAWKRYLDSLKLVDYFRGEREGTKLYKELLQKAKEAYLGGNVDENIANYIDKLLQDVPSPEEFRKNEILTKDDSDEWLYDDESFERILKERQKEMEEYHQQLKKTIKKDEKKEKLKSIKEEIEKKKGEEIVTGIKQFMKGTSTYEGVEPDKVKKQPQTRLDAVIQKMNELIKSGKLEGQELFDDEKINFEDFNEEGKLEEYMDLMDEELKGMKILDEKGDIDLNLLTNALESIKAQGGDPGPMSLLIKELGVDLPEPDDFIQELDDLSEEEESDDDF